MEDTYLYTKIGTSNMRIFSVSIISFLFLVGCTGKSLHDEDNPTEEHKYTNELIHETSPYLLQHAHNPVNWMPYGDAAFEKATAENKLVLISVGYSSCHWCHVMEEESFEDEEVAEYMNENFVCIKVDREERPDVDQIYMEAVEMMTGSGGWPLNCFTLPDGRPFFGGTYFCTGALGTNAGKLSIQLREKTGKPGKLRRKSNDWNSKL